VLSKFVSDLLKASFHHLTSQLFEQMCRNLTVPVSWWKSTPLSGYSIFQAEGNSINERNGSIHLQDNGSVAKTNSPSVVLLGWIKGTEPLKLMQIHLAQAGIEKV
jgi:hypothetical protein